MPTLHQPPTASARTGRSLRIDRTGPGAETRTRLLDLSIGLVEELNRDGARADRSPEDYCPAFQVCLPYRGLFVWHVGNDDIVGDPNQVVFVSGGETYRVSAPAPGGYAELIVTPEAGVLAELTAAGGYRLASHPLFCRRRCRANHRFQLLRTRFLHWATRRAGVADLEGDEVVLSLLRCALQMDGAGTGQCGPTTWRMIRRTKEFLEAELPNRIRLADVSHAVGASPAYLTDVFRRVEGVALHQYLTQLRLARALVELPHADDLTRLGLEVGFSSHSHFSAAFRRAFGCTPSHFRETARRANAPFD